MVDIENPHNCNLYEVIITPQCPTSTPGFCLGFLLLLLVGFFLFAYFCFVKIVFFCFRGKNSEKVT